ncbi:MAG: transposase [Caldilineaceae bacterium]|nr:transposase [Caldilineaceae bacterium]
MLRLNDKQWPRIFKFLRAHPNVYAGKQAACRRFVEGVHWVLRSRAQWRELPSATATGTACTNASPAGKSKASGRRCMRILRRMPIWKA